MTGVDAGRRMIRASGVPAPWMLSRVTRNGRDITDEPFDVVPLRRMSDVVLTFTDLAPSLSGTVRYASDASAVDMLVVAFSTDRSRWRPLSRHIAATRTDHEGHYRLGPLPAGPYLLVALQDYDETDINERDTLDQIARLAVEVTLLVGQTRAQDLRALPDQGRRIGCLLVHGLTSTPQSVRVLGEYLAEHGIDVEAVLLPGHGTTPEDLETTSWEDWYEAVRAGLDRLRPRCDHLFVCGQSMGGALAMRAAALEPVDGLITLAGFVYLRDWRVKLLPVLRHVMRWRKSIGNDIADPEAHDEVCYDRMSLRTVEALIALGREVQQLLPNVEVPALVIQSRVEPAAKGDPREQPVAVCRIRAPDKRPVAEAEHLSAACSASGRPNQSRWTRSSRLPKSSSGSSPGPCH